MRLRPAHPLPGRRSLLRECVGVLDDSTLSRSRRSCGCCPLVSNKLYRLIIKTKGGDGNLEENRISGQTAMLECVGIAWRSALSLLAGHCFFSLPLKLGFCLPISFPTRNILETRLVSGFSSLAKALRYWRCGSSPSNSFRTSSRA